MEDKIEYYDKAWQPIERKLRRRAERRVKMLMTLMAAQFAVVNYCVYFYLSWDIMEPMTVLIGNMEVLIAYYFFVLRRKEFTFKKVSESYFENKKSKVMMKEAFNFEHYR